MKKYYILSLICLSLSLVACNPPNKPAEPEALGAETQELLKQNLQNGVIPSPQAVKDNAIVPAPDKCEKFIAKIPPDWFREKLEVPEDPTQPEGRKIKIFYYGKIYPQSTPTIFFNGGPGSDSHSSSSSLNYAQETFDPKHKISFIFIDQRGNGCSDFFPQGKTEETLQRLIHYGSVGIVSDSEYVRKKLLKDKKWNVFGQSYGGHVVHRYIIQAPQGVKAGFSHANIVQASGFDRIKNRIASQARVIKTYIEQYPEDKAKLVTLKNYLTIDRCYINPYDKENKACGHELLSSFNMLLGFTESWVSLHQWLGIMVKDNMVSEDEVGRYLAAFYFSEDDSNPLNIKGWAGMVISWVDRNVENMNTFNCQKIKNQLLSEGIDLNDAYIHECIDALQRSPDPLDEPVDSPTMQLVKKLPRDLMTLDQLQNSLVQNPKIMLYLFSGQRDTFVPVENFIEELTLIKDLPNVSYTHFNGSGHEGFISEPKVWAELLKQSVVNAGEM